ncbi:hypothetical protein LCGC14_1636870 [marine sediment metagenome]|uniref:Uncharacterized protein n=1 Tax=marine sediment metagenome TaxID=412755 RepID=A0A0F9KGK4_9ZZZZ
MLHKRDRDTIKARDKTITELRAERDAAVKNAKEYAKTKTGLESDLVSAAASEQDALGRVEQLAFELEQSGHALEATTDIIERGKQRAEAAEALVVELRGDGHITWIERQLPFYSLGSRLHAIIEADVIWRGKVADLQKELRAAQATIEQVRFLWFASTHANELDNESRVWVGIQIGMAREINALLAETAQPPTQTPDQPCDCGLPRNECSDPALHSTQTPALVSIPCPSCGEGIPISLTPRQRSHGRVTTAQPKEKDDGV